jgi:enoyl-[acyl-carrier-protein] reductase (NADH)
MDDDVDLELIGKVALVTGSTAGIGFAIACSLAIEGAHIYVNARTQERVDAAMTAIDYIRWPSSSMASQRTFGVRQGRFGYCNTARGRPAAAAIATYAASELSSATNGAALRVDGGVVRAAVLQIKWK